MIIFFIFHSPVEGTSPRDSSVGVSEESSPPRNHYVSTIFLVIIMWVQFSRNLYVSTIFLSIINNFLAIIVWAYFSMQSLWEYNFPCNHYLSTLFHSIYMREKFSAQSLCAILKEIGMISLKLGWVSLGHWIDVYFGSFYHCWSKAGNAMVSGVVRCRWWISWVARFTWFHTAFSLPPWLDCSQILIDPIVGQFLGHNMRHSRKTLVGKSVVTQQIQRWEIAQTSQLLRWWVSKKVE